MSREDEFAFGRRPKPLLCSIEELPAIAADNGIELARFVDSLARAWVISGFGFTPEVLCESNRIAMKGIYECAGEFRREFRAAGDLIPPRWEDVPFLVDSMCEYVNAIADDALHAAAFVLWRINWIHPFYDGNGRIARELSYLALLTGNRMVEFPGSPTIPELIARNEDVYIECLREADRCWTSMEEVNLAKLESFLSDLLVEQIESGL